MSADTAVPQTFLDDIAAARDKAQLAYRLVVELRDTCPRLFREATTLSDWLGIDDPRFELEERNQRNEQFWRMLGTWQLSGDLLDIEETIQATFTLAPIK